MVEWVFNEKVSDDIDKIIREHLYLCYTKEYNHIWNIINFVYLRSINRIAFIIENIFSRNSY